MLARTVQRFAAGVSRRGYAAAAAQAKNANPEELRLTFASPDTALFSNAVVKQVDVPTLAGVVGVLANHVPTIGVLKPGVVQVTDNEGGVQRVFVSSGTLSVNIDGSCQVLAEEVLKIEDIDETAARNELEAAQKASGEGSEVAKAEAQIRVEVAEALLKAATNQH